MGSEPRGDRELVTAYQGGEVAAFEEIDRRYRPVAKRVCSRILFDQGDIEDAVQDTMVAVYRRLPTFNGQYLLGPYVARIATNRALDMIRYRKRRPQLPLTEALAQSIEADNDPVDQILVLDDAASVGRVLSEIPPTHARALSMRANDASHEEIAKDLHLTAPKAKALLHRARGSFRQAWLARLGVIIAAIGSVLRRGNDGIGSSTTTAAGAPVATGSSQFMATVTSLSANAAPMLNAAAVSAEPVVQTASRVVATAAAAVLTIGSAGAGVILSRGENAAETFVNPRPVVSEMYEVSPESSPPWSETPITTDASEHPSTETTSPAPAESEPGEPTDGSPSPSDPNLSDPSPSDPSPSTPPDPSPTTEPKPDPEPSAEPTPAPFEGRFASDTPTQERCRCGEGSDLRSSEHSGSPAGRFVSTWMLGGGILEPNGRAAWEHDSVLTFDVEGNDGWGRMGTKVIGTESSYRYDVELILVERAPGRDGGSILTLSGAYGDIDGPFGQGSLTVVLAVDAAGEPLQISASFRTA